MRKALQLLVHTPFVALADLFFIQAGLFAVLFPKIGYVGTPEFSPTMCANLVPLVSLLSVVILNLFGVYADWLRLPAKRLLYFLCVSSSLICVAVLLMLEWEQHARLPLTFLARSIFVVSALLAMYRLLLRWLYWSQLGRSRVMVMALDDDQALTLIRKFEQVAPGWMKFVGYSLLKDFGALEEASDSFDVILLAPGLTGERTLVDRCSQMRKRIMVVPGLMEMSLLQASVHEMEDLLVVELRSPHLTSGQRLMKRVFDLVAATTLLVLSSPLLLVTAILIRLTSNGPVLFKQDRVGRDGVEYQLYKFRTMVADAERHTGPVLARECDPRITRLGHTLRSTRIDELPQLINVLIGNMSMIGPRPERRFFVSGFRETLPDYDLRFAAKPGITGLAQVAGSYATPVEQKLKLDLLYISNYSVMRDIWIVLRTIPVVFHGERAEGIKSWSPGSIMVEEQ